jgi:hypothetical protein
MGTISLSKYGWEDHKVNVDNNPAGAEMEVWAMMCRRSRVLCMRVDVIRDGLNTVHRAAWTQRTILKGSGGRQVVGDALRRGKAQPVPSSEPDP